MPTFENFVEDLPSSALDDSLDELYIRDVSVDLDKRTTLGALAAYIGSSSVIAADVPIADAGTLYTATNVETALAEVKGIADSAIQPADLGDLAVKDTITVPGDVAATGTPSASTYLRGDGTWATPSGSGGGVTDHGDLTGMGDNDHPQYAAGGDVLPAGSINYQRRVDASTGQEYYWDGTFWVEIAGTPPAFIPADYQLSAFSGLVQPSQGGFGIDINQVDGDPAAALEMIGGAPSGHGHRAQWVIVTDTTYTLSPSDEGKILLFNVTGGAACAVSLPNQATQTGWAEGMVIGMLKYSAGAITITPGASVNVDGVVATPFTLVQHGISTLTRMPSNNFWNFSGQVGA